MGGGGGGGSGGVVVVVMMMMMFVFFAHELELVLGSRKNSEGDEDEKEWNLHR